MYVSQLTIEGFRGIRQGTVSLKRNSVLIAANNAGKTSIVEALALLLGRKGMRRDLSEYDFHGASPSPADRIQIRGVLTGFDSDEPEDLPSLFNMDRGGIPVWWDEDSKEVHHERVDGRSLAVEIGYSARFDSELLEWEGIRYFIDADVDPFHPDEKPNRISRSLLNEIGAFLLPADRSWELLTSFRSRTFRQVVKATDTFPGQAVQQVRNELREPTTKIEKADEFSDLVKRFNVGLSWFLGEESPDLQLRVTAGDTPSVLDSFHPLLRARAGVHVPVGRHGSGVKSLQTILLLLEFGRLRHQSGRNFILIGEEPELHLHPGHHRRLVARMRGVSNQTIITTHSPEVASFYRPEEILLLHCDEDGMLSARSLIENDFPDKNAVMRLYSLLRYHLCEALMNPVVLVPEGRTDHHWLRHLSQESITAEGWEATQEAMEVGPIGVLPTQSSHVTETFAHLSPVHPGMLPLVDGDAQGKQYIKALTELGSPPRRVVRLRSKWEIEDVVAWIIAGESDDLKDVAEVLDQPAIPTQQELADLLRTRFKTWYAKHEELVALVATRPTRLSRLRLFLAGIWRIGSGAPPREGWEKDAEASSAASTVWTFNPDTA